MADRHDSSTRASTSVRRIVLGHDANGEATVLGDETVPPVTVAMLPGVEIYRAWELDDTPKLPVTDLSAGAQHTFFPPTAGVRFGLLTIPPGLSYVPPAGTPAEVLTAAAAEAEEKLPGMAATFNPDRPGIHTTHTVDYIVALSGTGLMRVRDGVEVRVRAGDCLIQNGTPHGWFNDSTEPFVVAYTLVGAAAG